MQQEKMGLGLKSTIRRGQNGPGLGLSSIRQVQDGVGQDKFRMEQDRTGLGWSRIGQVQDGVGQDRFRMEQDRTGLVWSRIGQVQNGVGQERFRMHQEKTGLELKTMIRIEKRQVRFRVEEIDQDSVGYDVFRIEEQDRICFGSKNRIRREQSRTGQG